MNLTPYHERVINGLQKGGIRLLFDERLNLWSLVAETGVLKEIIMTEYVEQLVKGGLLKAVKPQNLPKDVRATKEHILTDKATEKVHKAHHHHERETDIAAFLKDNQGGSDASAIAVKIRPRPPSENLSSFMGDLADAAKLIYEGYHQQNKNDDDLHDFMCGLMTVCRITERIGPDAIHETMHALEKHLPTGERDSVGKRLSTMLGDLLSKKKKE